MLQNFHLKEWLLVEQIVESIIENQQLINNNKQNYSFCLLFKQTANKKQCSNIPFFVLIVPIFCFSRFDSRSVISQNLVVQMQNQQIVFSRCLDFFNFEQYLYCAKNDFNVQNIINKQMIAQCLCFYPELCFIAAVVPSTHKFMFQIQI
eukprot:TRINITY_DN37621_c0_g1_i1.p1 TRINITY_DN37621_c0_g1~~TRINITY_DN37621_c0_g1_i1.p1  ORF type:complete len:149 (-),score=3.03 TRINITY_DN37621_c0_g1_i1:184-630(-)